MSYLGSLVDPLTSAVNLGIGQGGKGIGSTLNKITGVDSQMDKSYKQQKAAMELQNQYNKEMWNLQNEYNSPSAQLARMADAGIEINPTAYALGSSNLSNTAGFVGSENGFAGSGSPAGNPISSLMSIAQGIQGVRESRSRQSEIGVDTDIKRHNLKIAKETNMPVGSMPGLEQTLVDYGRRTLGGNGPVASAVGAVGHAMSNWWKSKQSEVDSHQKKFRDSEKLLDNAYKSGKMSKYDYVMKKYF